MPKRNNGRARDGIQFAGALMPSLLPLMLKLGRTYLKFKKEAQRASRIFEKELRANGIDKYTAKAMTELYLESSHVLSAFDFSGSVGRGSS